MTVTRSRSSSRTERLTGSQEPSVRIAPGYEVTDGDDASKVMRVGGLKLDPWQLDGLRDWMALDDTGSWVSKTCGLSVPRQNGKSALVSGRASAGMVLYKEQVIYTAHLQKTATETFEEMRAFFEHPKMMPYVKEIKTAIGREQIILKNGARVKFLARTRNGGRGQHGDLLIFDEAQELDTDQQASFLPAISASRNPQTIYLGTPPDPSADGTVFTGLRKNAIGGTTTATSWYEFSVPEIGDVTDRKRWAATNPALGRRMKLSTIAGECEQMAPDTFARERLGWWTPEVKKTVEYAIPADVWDACASDDQKPEGRTAYGVRFSADGGEVTLCGAVIPADGPARISVIDRKPTGFGLQWLADWLNQRYQRACCVVVDGKNGVDVLIDKIAPVWRQKGSVIRANYKTVIASTGTLTDALNEQEVTWFRKQTMLRDSAVTSIKRPIAGGWGFGGEEPDPITAAALALWGAKTSKRDPNKRMRIG